MEASFARDVLSVVILCSWALPVLFVTIMLVVEQSAALITKFRNRGNRNQPRGPKASRRHLEVNSLVQSVQRAPVGTRSMVTSARVAYLAPVTRKSRVGARWKSQDRVVAAAC